MTSYGDVTQLTSKANNFAQLYYRALDSVENRPLLLNMYYVGESPLMQWNGHVLATPDDVAQYLQSLPKTKHQIDSLDVQPLPGNQNGDSMLVITGGTVIYDDEHKRQFFHRLVLRALPDDPAKYYIISDYMRWTGEST